MPNDYIQMQVSCSLGDFHVSFIYNHTQNPFDNFQELSIISYANYLCNYLAFLLLHAYGP